MRRTIAQPRARGRHLSGAHGYREPGPGDDPRAVLIVDDEPALRELMVSMFALEGFTPISVANAAEALIVLRGGTPVSVILLDLRLPIMTGWAFLDARRDDRLLTSIPVVITSGEADSSAQLLQADAFFPKPIDFTQLIACVRRLTAN